MYCKLWHPNCVSFRYLNTNSIRVKFSSTPHLIDNNSNISAIAETKLDSSFSESQPLLPESGLRKHFLLDVTSRKGWLLVFINNDIPSKFLQHFQFPIDIHGYSFRDKAKIAQAIDCFYVRTSRSKLTLFFHHGWL